jgi:hypothetical protein
MKLRAWTIKLPGSAVCPCGIQISEAVFDTTSEWLRQEEPITGDDHRGRFQAMVRERLLVEMDVYVERSPGVGVTLWHRQCWDRRHELPETWTPFWSCRWEGARDLHLDLIRRLVQRHRQGGDGSEEKNRWIRRCPETPKTRLRAGSTTGSRRRRTNTSLALMVVTVQASRPGSWLTASAS